MSESEDGTAAETYRYTNTKFARYMEKTGSSLAVVSAKKSLAVVSAKKKDLI